MSRSKWKGPFIDLKVLNSRDSKSSKKEKIWSRSSQIPSFLIGRTVFVHNGQDFKSLFVSRDKVGFKFGEFSLTRKYIDRNKSSKKKNK